MTTQINLSSDEMPIVDLTRKYVSRIERRDDGLVSFEFAIGWPELSVDLLLPEPAFTAFCQRHQVTRLDS
ncbi:MULTISPECIES: phenol hydroxylase subunit [Ralstonia]|jgi:phenol hydroxylase P0 protein|uniref:Phenol hydroxylase subunit n=2 Tax=Ralstonia TaxID=48736 RepID=A0ABT2LCC8_9RALS|nr:MULTISPECIES: phenol hydroxylase subunit [Ralstonia]KJK04253.1 phenol hydroxylase [Burkholderiaceae bacterium 26]MCO5410445.1 phenol hydroxylase subunit [Ralstonia mojiangensis]MCP1173872.1 phenol hydroxylase subunit [Ralstonia chuxiongensis]MCT7294885.1 phenol hydroxylase subunit [Ralstonia mojiangensis]MCT7313092.1 phenol hydroxylase subunit [Ralstonia mojiangensis]